MRQGDSERILAYYRENNCRIEEHPYGYRSVHYLVESSNTRYRYLAEVQVRTIFEEAWGEIDHVVRYPYHLDNEMLVRLSSILNRLAGDADELGTYMRYLKGRTAALETGHERELAAKNQVIDDLRRQINELAIGHEQKQEIQRNLNELGKRDPAKPAKSADGFPWLDSLMETPLFKNISHRIEKLVKSRDFQPIEVTPEDLKVMRQAQGELFTLFQDPEKLRRLVADETESRETEEDAEGR